MKKAGIVLAAVTALVISGAGSGAAKSGEWTTEPFPVRPDTSSSLHSVSTGDGQTWAFGSWYQGVPAFTSQAYHRTAAGWNEVPVPNLGQIVGSAVVSADDVWAVSRASKSGRSSSMHWDGAAWSEVPLPTPPGTGLSPNDMTAFGPHQVWAVGGMSSSGPEPSPASSFAMRWDGSTWRHTPLPPVAEHVDLKAIDGTAPNDIWATGTTDANPAQIVTLHWDGNAWSEVPVPQIPGAATEMLQVADLGVAAPNDAWISATHNSDAGNSDEARPILLHWDGNAWSKRTAPQPSGVLGEITSAEGTLWLFGDQVYRRDGATWRPAGAPAEGAPSIGTRLPDGRLLAIGHTGMPNARQPYAAVHQPAVSPASP